MYIYIMNIPHIAILLNWRNQVNKTGLYSIHIRAKIGEDARYYKIDTPQKIRPEEWSGKEDAWVKSSHPFAFEINNKIIEKKALLHDLIRRSFTFNKTLSFETIEMHLKRKGNSNSFFEYMQNYITNPPEKLEINTLKKYRTCLTHLRKFRKQLFFSDIDNILVKEFYKFMQTTLNLGGGASKKYMESFKKVVRNARKENYLDPAQMEFLFDDVRIKVKKPKRVFLEIPEILKWKSATFPKGKEYLARDRDLFLFQVYTGYYYKDLLIFTKDQLLQDEQYGNIIIGARDKNDNQTIIPLFKFPHASTIIRRYQSSALENRVFDPAVFIEEPAYNRNLKEIARLAGIPKSISNKVARHTNAQLWIRYGAERPIVSKMMGHTKEQTTENYYDVNIPEIIEGTKRVDFRKLGI
jgi:site-specific recombinase XerD